MLIPCVGIIAKNDSIYIDKLKLADAIELKLDKSVDFQFAEAKYKSQLFMQRFPVEYRNSLEKTNAAQEDAVKVRMIFRSLPQRMNLDDEKLELALVDSIYNAFYIADDIASFRKNIAVYSEVKGDIWLTRHQETDEFHEVVKNLKINGISKPFTSPKGVYIVQKIAEEKTLVERHDESDSFSKLLKMYKVNVNNSINVENIKEYSSSEVIISTPYKEFTVEDFYLFSTDQQYSLSGSWRLFQRYVLSQSLQNEIMATKEMKNAVLGGRDSLLLSLVYDSRVRKIALNDIVGQQEFFKRKEGEYLFNYTHFKGTLIYGKRKKIKKLRKVLHDIPKEKWPVVVHAINGQRRKPDFEMFSGQSILGDNIILKGCYKDSLLPQSSKRKKLMEYYLLDGKFIQPRMDSDLIRSVVLKDYMNSLEEEWIKQLIIQDKSRKID